MNGSKRKPYVPGGAKQEAASSTTAKRPTSSSFNFVSAIDPRQKLQAQEKAAYDALEASRYREINHTGQRQQQAQLQQQQQLEQRLHAARNGPRPDKDRNQKLDPQRRKAHAANGSVQPSYTDRSSAQKAPLSSRAAQHALHAQHPQRAQQAYREPQQQGYAQPMHSDPLHNFSEHSRGAPQGVPLKRGQQPATAPAPVSRHHQQNGGLRPGFLTKRVKADVPMQQPPPGALRMSSQNYHDFQHQNAYQYPSQREPGRPVHSQHLQPPQQLNWQQQQQQQQQQPPQQLNWQQEQQSTKHTGQVKSPPIPFCLN